MRYAPIRTGTRPCSKDVHQSTRSGSMMGPVLLEQEVGVSPEYDGAIDHEDTRRLYPRQNLVLIHECLFTDTCDRDHDSL
jgi:hypothetical protein